MAIEARKQAEGTMKNTLRDVVNTMTKAALLITLIGVASAFGDARAATSDTKKPVLIELFTSEGCSSCPPADRLLQSLDEKQPFAGAELVVLSEHVDYWNGDGWVDPYSARLFSERQRLYAEQFDLDSVYTPQVVVDGQRETVGSNAVAIRDAVEQATRDQKVRLTVSNPVRDGNKIKFHLASGDLKDEATLYVALADNKVQSQVAGGENGGRLLTHVAVVRVLAPMGTVKAGSSLAKDDKSHKILGATEEKI
jgi:hypothetical protein